MTSKETKLNGLVLAGGKSTRMGEDKGLIKWYGKEQRYYLADLLDTFCDEVYISCRDDQQEEIERKGYNALVDKFGDAGPSVGILTAFSHRSDTAWLVVACDLPLLDKETLQFLINNRDEEKVATTFKSPHDGLPEPLITIWEPKGYEVLKSFQQQGYKCPRKALINSDTNIIEPSNATALMNTNTPEEAAKVRNIIAHAE